MNLNTDNAYAAQEWLVDHGYQRSELTKMDDGVVLELYYKEKSRVDNA